MSQKTPNKKFPWGASNAHVLQCCITSQLIFLHTFQQYIHLPTRFKSTQQTPDSFLTCFLLYTEWFVWKSCAKCQRFHALNQSNPTKTSDHRQHAKLQYVSSEFACCWQTRHTCIGLMQSLPFNQLNEARPIDQTSLIFFFKETALTILYIVKVLRPLRPANIISEKVHQLSTMGVSESFRFIGPNKYSACNFVVINQEMFQERGRVQQTPCSLQASRSYK